MLFITAGRFTDETNLVEIYQTHGFYGIVSFLQTTPTVVENFTAVKSRAPLVPTQLNAQGPLAPFLRSFPVDEEVANLLRTCCGEYGETGVMDFGLYLC